MPNVGAYQNQVKNLNLLSNVKFNITIDRFPEVVYFVESASLAGISFPAIDRGNQLVNIREQGDHLLYDDFLVKFKVDEAFKNWYSIYFWMTGITFPKSTDQFKALKNANTSLRPDSGNLYSDITVTMMSNKSNPIINVYYRNAFPVRLSEIIFNTTEQDINPIVATVNFAYTYYDIEFLT